MRVIGLIPSRIGSKRLSAKALLPLNNIPLIVHVLKRAQLSKRLTDVVVCCDDKKILKAVRDFGGKALLTSKKHHNGTERIAAAYKSIKKNYDLVLDIQGDEPLINPRHIDSVINYHIKNIETDIVVPSLKTKYSHNENIVKITKDLNNNVLYFSRASIPFQYKKRTNFYHKHLSIISFKPLALKKFANSKQTVLERIEGIELLRALEIGLKIKSPLLNGDSFSIDIKADYLKAKLKFEKDKILRLYKK